MATETAEDRYPLTDEELDKALFDALEVQWEGFRKDGAWGILPQDEHPLGHCATSADFIALMDYLVRLLRWNVTFENVYRIKAWDAPFIDRMQEDTCLCRIRNGEKEVSEEGFCPVQAASRAALAALREWGAKRPETDFDREFRERKTAHFARREEKVNA